MHHNLKNRVKNLVNPILNRLILNHEEGRIAITGCARSGTAYTSKLFKSYGYSIGHESLERHGISSWCLVPATSARCWGPSSRELNGLGIPLVHQVRHPIDVIASVSTAGEYSWKFIEKFIPIKSNDSILLKCMKYWYHWNVLAESQAEFTYRVDAMEAALPRLFQLGGFDASRLDSSIVRSFPKDVNRRDHPCVTRADLESEDSKLVKQILELATHYGFFFE